MIIASVAFYAMAFRVQVVSTGRYTELPKTGANSVQQKRMFHILTAFITTFAAISYYGMAVKSGVSFNEIKLYQAPPIWRSPLQIRPP